MDGSWMPYAVIALIVCVVVLFGIIIYQSSTSKERFNQLDNATTSELKGLREMIGAKGGIQGPVGPSGPSGPSGAPGGTYLNQGVLRNLAHPNLYLDRTAPDANNGNQSISLLYDGKLSTNQHWTLQSNGQLRNQAGRDCLTITETPADGRPGQIRMKTCQTENAKQKWSWDQYGRITSQENPGLCLNITPVQSGTLSTTKLMERGTDKTVDLQFPEVYHMVEVVECPEPDAVGTESVSTRWTWS